MGLSENEYIAVIPISSLAIGYWLKDRYLFNRATNAFVVTTVQWKVLFFVYPLWMFFGWINALQVNRKHVASALLSTLAWQITGYSSVVTILNDSFRITQQQLFGWGIGIVIAYMWTTYWLVVTSDNCEEITNVVNQGHECNCST